MRGDLFLLKRTRLSKQAKSTQTLNKPFTDLIILVSEACSAYRLGYLVKVFLFRVDPENRD
tara:strand:+ start:903 stop:1085 length:183 start_codon:yes stop_codon:yes gene_type:complete